jgi:hypothetical protein
VLSFSDAAAWGSVILLFIVGAIVYMVMGKGR